MNKYQETIEKIRICTTMAYTDVCYHQATKGSMMKIEKEIYNLCEELKPLIERQHRRNRLMFVHQLLDGGYVLFAKDY